MRKQSEQARKPRSVVADDRLAFSITSKGLRDLYDYARDMTNLYRREVDAVEAAIRYEEYIRASLDTLKEWSEAQLVAYENSFVHQNKLTQQRAVSLDALRSWEKEKHRIKELLNR